MKIGVDVMGGDYAPLAIIKGAILAQKEISVEDKIVLFGDQDTINKTFAELSSDISLFDIVHCSETISMCEQPTKAITQKLDSSIAKGFGYLKAKQIDGFCSAGNTGAMLVGAMYSVKSIPGIMRPCTCTILPKEDGSTGVLLDVGTNPDAKPDLLCQFGLIGSLYAKYVFNIENPKVGLLNIGEEEEKGNILTQSAYKLMHESTDFIFAGNVESRDLFKNKADVVVCDGFTGNILLKQIETMYRMIMKRGFNDSFFNRMNYEIYGGTPILGLNETVIIGHGISNDIATKNMILQTKHVHESGLISQIRNAITIEN